MPGEQSRALTNSPAGAQDVDGRVKPGHDQHL
jgi:hypothetical protein